jgi:DNA repair protein RadC
MQAYNPQTKRWVKIETRTGRIVGRKRTAGAYKDLPKRKTVLKTSKPAAKPANGKAKTASRKKQVPTGKNYRYAKPMLTPSIVRERAKSKKTPKLGIPDKIPTNIPDMGYVNIRTQQVQVECKKLQNLKHITMPKDVADIVGDMAMNDREELRALYLNTGNKVIGIESSHRGSVDACFSEPHEIFKTALLLNATGIILVHNHPSGNPKPSEADIKVAGRFVEVGKSLGVKVLDSIIIGNGTFYSLQQEGDVTFAS